MIHQLKKILLLITILCSIPQVAYTMESVDDESPNTLKNAVMAPVRFGKYLVTEHPKATLVVAAGLGTGFFTYRWFKSKFANGADLKAADAQVNTYLADKVTAFNSAENKKHGAVIGHLIVVEKSTGKVQGTLSDVMANITKVNNIVGALAQELMSIDHCLGELYEQNERSLNRLQSMAETVQRVRDHLQNNNNKGTDGVGPSRLMPY